MSLCEWNPEKNRPSQYLTGRIYSRSGKTDGCQNEATVCVGYNGKWHLCESCASLPIFKKYRKRKSLNANRC